MYRQSLITLWITIIAACCVLKFAKSTDEVKPASACSLPSQISGPCFAAFRRWSYDVEKRACQKFIYGGCLGNENNFESLEECKKTCENRNKIEVSLIKKLRQTPLLKK